MEVTGSAVIDTTCMEGAVSDALRSALVTGGFTGGKCVIAPPQSEVWTQVVRMPDMSDSEMTEAVAWEAAERLGVPRDRLQCDWIRLAEAADRSNVLAIAIDRSKMEDRLSAVMAAGLRPVAVEPDFLAVARLFSRRHRRDVDASRTRAVLHMGLEGSMLMVLRGKSIVFCKHVCIGGRHLDAAVADQLDLEPAAAAELRQARLADPTALDPSTNGAVASASKTALADLAREVMRCLRHYTVAVRGERPEYLLLSGDSASEPGLCELMHGGCRLEVTLDDDASSIAQVRDGIAASTAGLMGPASAWAASAGLSVRGVESKASAGRRAA